MYPNQQPQYGPDGWPVGAAPAAPAQPYPQHSGPQHPQHGGQQYPPAAPAPYGPGAGQNYTHQAPPPQGYGYPPAPPVPQRPAGPPPSPDELMSGGFKAAQFPDQAFGTVVGGEIVDDPQTTQQIDFDSQRPKFYEDGNPAWQIVVPVQAFGRQGDDDGVRAFYLKGQMKKAAQDAVRAAGADKLRKGGQLFMRYVRDEPNARGRGKPKKIYEGRYTAPVAGPSSVPGAVATGPAQQAAPAPAPPAAPAGYGQAPAAQQYGPPPGPVPQSYAPPAPPPAPGYMGAEQVAGVAPGDPWSAPAGGAAPVADTPPY